MSRIWITLPDMDVSTDIAQCKHLLHICLSEVLLEIYQETTFIRRNGPHEFFYDSGDILGVTLF